MAATLLAIKSRMLLPAPIRRGEADGERRSQEELVELLEYKKYKQLAEFCGNSNPEEWSTDRRSLRYAREENPVGNLTPDDLFQACQVLSTAETAAHHPHCREEVSVGDRMEDCSISFGKRRTSAFPPSPARATWGKSLPPSCPLELMKTKRVICRQEQLFDEISS